MTSQWLLMAAPDGFPGSIVADWYRWVAALPPPFRVVSLILVAWVLIRLVVRYGGSPLAAMGRALARGFVHLVTWVAIVPEYALNSVAIRYWDRSLPGSFGYGETVASFNDAGERTIARVGGRLGRRHFPPGRVAFWSVVIVLLVVNIAAYFAHAALPITTWWHSVTAWVNSLRHHASPSPARTPRVRLHHHHHRHG